MLSYRQTTKPDVEHLRSEQLAHAEGGGGWKPALVRERERTLPRRGSHEKAGMEAHQFRKKVLGSKPLLPQGGHSLELPGGAASKPSSSFFLLLKAHHQVPQSTVP